VHYYFHHHHYYHHHYPFLYQVIPVEETEEGEVGTGGEEKSIKILSSGSSPGQWVRAVGSDMAVGEVVLEAGTLVSGSNRWW